MSLSCKVCGCPIQPHLTSQELQKTQDNYAAEYPFMAPTDRYSLNRSIQLLRAKLALEQNGFCCEECAENHDRYILSSAKKDGVENDWCPEKDLYCTLSTYQACTVPKKLCPKKFSHRPIAVESLAQQKAKWLIRSC